MSRRSITLTVNEETYSVDLDPHRTLLEVLRDTLELTGTKANCLDGECGVCTVLLDGQPVNSCLYLAVRADGKQVRTVEGVARGGDLHPVQRAFIEAGAVQCGYCTPGYIMSVVALLQQSPSPGEAEIERALAGNLCRCTGYVNIRRAVAAAIDEIGGTRE